MISKDWGQHPEWFENLSVELQHDLIAMYNINNYTQKEINHKRTQYNRRMLEVAKDAENLC